MKKYKNIPPSILGFVIGDAMGVPYEYKKRDTFKCDDMRASTFKDAHFPLPLGSWSDDTSMMLCVLDALSEKYRYDMMEKPPQTQNQILLHKEKVKKKIYKKFRRNAVQWMLFGKFTNHGYIIPYDVGNSCRRGIVSMMLHIKNKRADDIKSNGNGGLMRLLPLAFANYENNNEIMEYIKLFNKNSHNHKISHIGCLIYILLAKELKTTKDIRQALENTVAKIEEKYKIPTYQKIWDLSILEEKRENIKSTGYIVDTLESVIWCLYNGNSYEENVLIAVNLGGDTDTIAALVGGLSAIIYDNIPEKWIENIRKKDRISKIIHKTTKWR